jgi:acyl-CoA thioesterase
VTKFDRDTAIRPLGAGRYEADVSPDWRIVRGANGGHLAAMLLRAMTDTIGDPSRAPVSYTVHFARVPKETTVEIETTVERTGRTMSTVTARMLQDGKVQVVGIAAFTTPRTGPDFSDIRMPEVPRPAELGQSPDRPDFPFGHHFDFRPVALSGEMAEVMLWIRPREPQPLDHFVVTQLADAFAPAVFVKLGAGGGGAGVPTIELTYHFREPLPLAGARDDDWYLAVFRTLTSRAGFIEEDGWLWSAGGTLVAQSRQCALLSISST